MATSARMHTKQNASIMRKLLSTALAALLCLWMVPVGAQQASAATSNNASVASWDAVFDGTNYVITITGTNGTQYFPNQLQVTYVDGTQGANTAIVLTGNGDQWNPYGSVAKNSWWGDIAGSSVAVSGNAVTITVPASYFDGKDFAITYCGSSIASTEMGGGSAGGSTGGTTDPEPEPTPTPTPDPGTSGSGSADSDNSGTTTPDQGAGDSGSTGGAGAGSETYPDSGSTGSGSTDSGSTGGSASGGKSGIVIDGDFSDWDNIKKYSIDESEWHPWGNSVDEVAMVWDGDWVYLYFCSYGTPTSWDPTKNQGNWNSVTGAGPHGNGQFAITTDLGNQTLVQPTVVNNEPAVAGVDGAKAAVNNKDYFGAPHKWEVAIPASALGDYKETIDFGLYQVDPTIKDIADLQGNKGGEFNGIVYDGKYDDWKYYPHTTIEYATSGTQESVVDSRGALYADSEQQKLFGHVVTNMPQHLNEAGGEFTRAVSIRINDDDDLMLTPRFIAVDADGNINWNPQLSDLADGTYEFYLTSTTVNGTSKNINDLQADDVIYGKAKITIADGQQDMEWYMDIPTLAANLHSGWGQSKETVSIDPNDIKKFAAQYGRLGQQWVETAGTSTAPFLGIGLCIAMVGAVYGWRRHKRNAAGAADSEAATASAA